MPSSSSCDAREDARTSTLLREALMTIHNFHHTDISLAVGKVAKVESILEVLRERALQEESKPCRAPYDRTENFQVLDGFIRGFTLSETLRGFLAAKGLGLPDIWSEGAPSLIGFKTLLLEIVDRIDDQIAALKEDNK